MKQGTRISAAKGSILSSAIGTQQSGGWAPQMPPPQPAAAPMSQIEASLNRLSNDTGELAMLLGEFEKRIDIVLNPSMSGEADLSGNAPQHVRSVLAAAIDQQSDHLAAMSARVRLLLDRLAT